MTGLVPFPPTTGSGVRIFNLLRYISHHHDVSLVSLFLPSTGEDKGATYLKTFCTHIELVRRERSRYERYLGKMQGVLAREPKKNVVYHFKEMANKVRTLTENEHFDLIDIQQDFMAPYIKAISPANRGRKILTLHDVPYVQYHRMLSIERDWHMKWKIFRDWLFVKRATLKYAQCFDKCVVVSEFDRDTLQQAGPDLNISVVPNGVDTRGYPLLTNQPSTPSSILFVGTMRYQPNVDGAIFFCQEIFPLIKQQIPGAKLLIVGREPPSFVQALASTNIIVTGAVESVVPYYQRASVSIVPLRAGSGSRLKILESMALGRPVVSTTLGCEGLAVTHGENILIADTPVDFAAQIVRLLNDPELRQRLIVNGRRLVETIYDWGVISQRLLQVYEDTESKQ